MSIHTKALGLLTLPAFLLAGCEPAQEGQPRGDIDAAEAPPMERPAVGMDDTGFSEWDLDGDRSLDRTEFAAWMNDEDVFDDWLTDEGVADFEAITEDVHDAMDVDGDGSVTESDWAAATQRLRSVFGDGDPGTFNEWDVDNDGEIDLDEFRVAAEQRGLREELDGDGDGRVTRQDLETFYFELLDANGDGRIDASEWERHRDWFGNDMIGM